MYLVFYEKEKLNLYDFNFKTLRTFHVGLAKSIDIFVPAIFS